MTDITKTCEQPLDITSGKKMNMNDCADKVLYHQGAKGQVDIDTLVIVPPEKPLKMKAQPIVAPRVKRLWQSFWVKSHDKSSGAPKLQGVNEQGLKVKAGDTVLKNEDDGCGIFYQRQGNANELKTKPWFGEAYARLAAYRRRLLSALVVVSVAAALFKWLLVMPSDITVWTKAAVIILFILTFGWIALYFWSSILGFKQLMEKARVPGIFYPKDVDEAIAKGAQISAEDMRNMSAHLQRKTAILMPIYNEEPAQVMARLLAIAEDIKLAGAARKFDIFVLSDTTNPKVWVKEEKIWFETKKIMENPNFGRNGEIAEQGEKVALRINKDTFDAEDVVHLYYRRRAQNIARKSGNIEDFCNRWGAEYDFMLVLDADSLMTAETIIKMARLMEENYHAGIIQASPQMINSTSMFARMQQFSGKVAGPVVGAGLAYWQVGNSNYWGHNAIIRTRAFIDCCGLPKLKGKGPFGGFILSHDFVEAALIARGGWSAWLLPELKGSYEECPPSMIDFAARDRRWCQGNLQHIKVLISKGLHPVSRVHFTTGIMSYLSSPLWLLFLLAGLSMVLFREFVPAQYFGTEYSLFPNWPIFDKNGTIGLFVLSMAMLLVPKFLGLAVYWRNLKDKAQQGAEKMAFGLTRVGSLLGLIVEIVISTLIAPVMMLFQSKFVFDILRGKSVSWNAQNRGDEGTSWHTAWQIHKWHTILGVVTAMLVWRYAHVLFWWMSPITLGLMLSVPLSVFSSRVSVGRKFKDCGLFVIPEEINEPKVLARAKNWAEILTPFEQGEGGLVMLQNDKTLSALHAKMLPINGPAPQFEDEVISLAEEKLAAGRLHELSKDEEMWALYQAI